MRCNFTNSTSSPQALCLSLSKCANGFISLHHVCTISELHTARLKQELSKFTCIVTKVYNLHYFKFDQYLNHSALVRSPETVCSCTLNNCPIVKTKIHSMIKHLITYIKNKSSLPQESPKRGIHPIFKNETQALKKSVKIPIGVSL